MTPILSAYHALHSLLTLSNMAASYQYEGHVLTHLKCFKSIGCCICAISYILRQSREIYIADCSVTEYWFSVGPLREKSIAPAPALSPSSKKPVARPLEIRPTDCVCMFNCKSRLLLHLGKNLNYLLAIRRVVYIMYVGHAAPDQILYFQISTCFAQNISFLKICCAAFWVLSLCLICDEYLLFQTLKMSPWVSFWPNLTWHDY